MSYKQIALYLQNQVKHLNEQLECQSNQAAEREGELLKVINDQRQQLSLLSAQIKTLNNSVVSLEQVLVEKNIDLENQKIKNSTLGKLISGKKSEKVSVCPKEETPVARKKPDLKERGNNGAKRKEHFDLEIQEHDIYPDQEDFRLEASKRIRTTDCIRYEFIPPRFIKHIYHQHYYACNDSVYAGKLPAAPFLNSNYDASFIAGMLQLRYIYSMPIERIIKYFKENGFDLNKSTAHSLIKKAAGMFDLLSQTLQSAILEDDYLCMDESYYTILTGDVKNKSGKSTTKGYIWAALANHLKLVHFFYENGSRSRQVLTGYVKEDYQGAIQSDGLENYKIIEKETYPNAIRLSCFQHCKRKFLNITGNKDAQKIVDTINLLYQKEHLIEPDWPSDRILEYRNKYASPILDKLEKQLLAIKEKKTTLPKSELSKAVNYTLGQYDSLRNYILNADYALDNNAIERLMRYISLSRKNSLFCGSHQGAKNAALIYSLACSCRLNNINTFEYFKDLLNKLIDINPNTDPAIIRNLLPDRYKGEHCGDAY